MENPPADNGDRQSHMQQAIDIACEAAERGDHPFGSVLVHDNTVVIAESNPFSTENDIRRHPELHLAYRACQELTLPSATRGSCTRVPDPASCVQAGAFGWLRAGHLQREQC